MRPTVPVFLSLILLAGLLPASVEAQGAIRCVKTGFTRCRCISPYKVRCANAEGHVQWNAIVGQAHIIIKDDRGRIKDEFTLGMSQLQDLNLHTLHDGTALREKLESMGKLQRGHSHEIQSFWLSGGLPMFEDTDGQNPMGTIAEVNRRMEPPDRCFYTEDPYAIDIRSPDGYSTTVCIGRVQCSPRNGGNEYVNTAICLGQGFQGDVGSCPNATSCAAEEVPEIRIFSPVVPRGSR